MSYLCAAPVLLYGCTNATGTTCTKSAQVRTLALTGTNPPCATGSMLVVDGADASSVVSASTGLSAVETNIASLNDTDQLLLGYIAQLDSSMQTLLGGLTGGGGTTSGTVTVAPYTATQDDYTALSTIFGLVLAAAVVIWGLKQIYNIFANPAES